MFTLCECIKYETTLSDVLQMWCGWTFQATLKPTCPGNTARVVCFVQPTQSPWLQTSLPVASPPAAFHHYHYSAETEGRERNDDAEFGCVDSTDAPIVYNNFIGNVSITHKGSSFFDRNPVLEQVTKKRKLQRKQGVKTKEYKRQREEELMIRGQNR